MWFRLFIILGSFLFLLSENSLSAQNPFHVGIELGRGKTYRHRPQNMPFTLDRPAQLYAIHAMWETSEKHYWNIAHRQPRMGFALMAQRYGNDSTLGWGIGVIPQVDFWIFRREHFSIFLRGGFGLTFITKPYRRGSNENNTAIGSIVNNLTSVALCAEYSFGKFALNATARISHNSNGRFQDPNLGLNMGSWGLAASVQLGGESQPILPRKELEHNKSWKPGIRIGFGAHQIGVPGGPRFPVQVLSGFFVKSLSPKFRLWLQGEVSHQSAARAFAYRNPPRNTLIQSELAWRYSAGAAGEVLMGQVGFTAQYMIYLDPPFKYSDFFAFKVGPTMYLIPPNEAIDKPNLFVGAFLKAHQAVAQYIEISAGVIF